VSALLELEEISAGYGDGMVLHGVSLSVGRGEVVSLLGRNGAGKTTILLAVMGYLTLAGGRISLAGRSIAGLKPHRIARAGLGFVPQEREIFPSLTVRENLTVAARPGRWDLTAVTALFPRLAERAGNLGFQLSGGEQQMLSIARALMLNPQLLLLDEPSEGLAPLIVEEIVQVILRLKSEGLAVLLVEQNLQAALDIADRHHIIGKGVVQWTGSSAELAGNDEILRTYLAV
jgi:branched-chain amino acid transport system ATP-binding protein